MTRTVSIFGYGSLVNMTTHRHSIIPAIAIGWRRIWREIPGRDYAILSATAYPGFEIAGALISVPKNALPALDLREAEYVRMGTRITNKSAGAEIYIVQAHASSATKPILRSYLDVVLAGFETTFGRESLQPFYETTLGWGCGIVDDRNAPIYPRYQEISVSQGDHYDDLHREFLAH